MRRGISTVDEATFGHDELVEYLRSTSDLGASKLLPYPHPKNSYALEDGYLLSVAVEKQQLQVETQLA